MAIGDFDNNGAVDVLVAVNNDVPILLRNTGVSRNHWLGLHLIGTKCTQDAVGAIVAWQAGDLKRHICKVGGGSYLSSHDPRLALGIGQRSKIDWCEVKWPAPSGLVEQFTARPVDKYYFARRRGHQAADVGYSTKLQKGCSLSAANPQRKIARKKDQLDDSRFVATARLVAVRKLCLAAEPNGWS